MAGRLAAKVVLVTGGGTGIGRAIAARAVVGRQRVTATPGTIEYPGRDRTGQLAGPRAAGGGKLRESGCPGGRPG